MNRSAVTSSVNAREEIISLIKQYKSYVIGAAILGLIITASLLTYSSSNKKVNPNVEFIELQNPDINKYDLDYIIEETEQDAIVENSKQNIDQYLRSYHGGKHRLSLKHVHRNYTDLLRTCGILEAQLKWNKSSTMLFSSNTSRSPSFFSNFMDLFSRESNSNNNNVGGENYYDVDTKIKDTRKKNENLYNNDDKISLYSLIKVFHQHKYFHKNSTDKIAKSINSTGNHNRNNQVKFINRIDFVNIGINDQSILMSDEIIYKDFNVSGMILTTNPLYFAKLQETIQHVAKQTRDIRIQFDTVKQYSQNINKLLQVEDHNDQNNNDFKNNNIDQNIDIISIKGNDFECQALENILRYRHRSQHQRYIDNLPKIIEISFNYIFPPPLKFIIQTPSHLFQHKKAHYMYGCSIEYLTNHMLHKYGYQLVELTPKQTAIYVLNKYSKTLKLKTYSNTLNLIEKYYTYFQNQRKKIEYEKKYLEKSNPFLLDDDTDIKPFFNHDIENTIGAISYENYDSIRKAVKSDSTKKQENDNDMTLKSYYNVKNALNLVLTWVLDGFHKQDGILELGCSDYLLEFKFDGDPTCSGISRCSKKENGLIATYKEQSNSNGRAHTNYLNTAGIGKLGFLILIFLTCTVTITCLALSRAICKEQDYKIAKFLRYGRGKWD